MRYYKHAHTPRFICTHVLSLSLSVCVWQESDLGSPSLQGEGMARWQALESSPEVLSSLARALTSDERWRVHDVWGLDDDLLAMCVDETSCRCAALVLLFPSKAGRPVRATTDEEKKRTEGMYFLRQDRGRLENACGTIAVCHALANVDAVNPLEATSRLGEFVAATRAETPTERGAALDKSDAVHDVHAELVVQGQSEVLESARVAHHFASFVERDGAVVELDGAYNDGPAVVGEVQDGRSFLQAAAGVIMKKYLEPSAGAIDFSVLALVYDHAPVHRS